MLSFFSYQSMDNSTKIVPNYQIVQNFNISSRVQNFNIRAIVQILNTI